MNLEKISQPFQIYTSNLQLSEYLNQRGKNSKFLGEIFPPAAQQTNEVNKIGRKILEDYRKLFLNITYHGIEIFSSIELQLLKEIIFLEKIQRILEEKRNVVFILDDFSYSFFSILNLSSELGYDKSNQKIYQISNTAIKIVSSKNKNFLLNNKRKYQYLQRINFSRLSRTKNKKNLDYNDPLINKKIQSNKNEFKTNSILENHSEITPAFLILKLIIKSYGLKFFQILNIDVTKSILKKIDQKIQNSNSNYNANCALFLTSKRDDLLKPIYQIIEEFNRQEIPHHIFIFDLMTNPILTRRKIIFQNLFEESYLLSQIIKRSKTGKNIRKQIEEIISDKFKLFSIRQFSNFILNEIFRAIAIMIICEHIFGKLDLKSIVTAFGATRNGNAVMAASKNFGITSYSLLTQLLNFDPLLSNLYRADKLCAFGEAASEMLIRLGYSKNKIVLTGNPRYDYLPTLDSKTQKLILKDLHNIVGNKKLILIAMSRWHANDEIWMSKLIAFCNKNNFEIIIKIHPIYRTIMHDTSERKIKQIKNLCKNMKYHTIYDTDLSILLSATDLVITDFSNAGIEAILLEKPLVTVNFTQESHQNVESFHEYNASIYINDYPELEQILLEVLSGGKHLQQLKEGRKKIINRYNFYNDGKAALRIVNLLLNRKYSSDKK